MIGSASRRRLDQVVAEPGSEAMTALPQPRQEAVEKAGRRGHEVGAVMEEGVETVSSYSTAPPSRQVTSVVAPAAGAKIETQRPCRRLRLPVHTPEYKSRPRRIR